MAGNEDVLAALQAFRDEVKTEIRESNAGLMNQLADVAAVAREALNTAKDAKQQTERLTHRVDGSLPPDANPPPPEGGDGATPNGAKIPSPPPLVRRVTDAEGSLTDVIGQIGNLKDDVKAVQATVEEVKALNVKQNKTMGLADDAATIGKKVYTILMSRDGATFAARLGMLFALVYGAFVAQRAITQIQATQQQQMQQRAEPPALTTGAPP